MNYWLWLLIITVPIIIFGIKPNVQNVIRDAAILLTILICYILINLAIQLRWDLVIEAVQAIPYPTLEELNKASADGPNRVFVLYFGWIFSIMYVGWWQIAWQKYYQNEIKLMTNFKYSWIEKMTLIISKILSAFFFLYIILLIYAFYLS